MSFHIKKSVYKVKDKTTNSLAISNKKIYYINMYKTLRIIFCLLAVACAAVTVFIFVFFNLWGLVPLGGAVIFAALMFVCKRAQESEELKNNPPDAEGDFITGRVKNPDSEDK